MSAEVFGQGRIGTHVGVTVRTSTFFTRVKTAKLPAPSTDPTEIRRVALEVLARFELDRPVRLLGVRIDLAEPNEAGPAPDIRGRHCPTRLLSRTHDHDAAPGTQRRTPGAAGRPARGPVGPRSRPDRGGPGCRGAARHRPGVRVLSALARRPAMPQQEMTTALYDDRALVRMLGMRRTMFVVPTTFVPVVQHSSSDAVAARLRTRLVKELSAVVDGDAERWLADVEDAVVELLRSDGPALAAELSKAEPRLRTQLMFGPADKAYGGPQAITSRVLNLLSAQSRIIRGRPTNGWAGSRYRWEVVESWLPDGLPRMAAPWPGPSWCAVG